MLYPGVIMATKKKVIKPAAKKPVGKPPAKKIVGEVKKKSVTTPLELLKQLDAATAAASKA
jgi:hypothetical protein